MDTKLGGVSPTMSATERATREWDRVRVVYTDGAGQYCECLVALRNSVIDEEETLP